jgi:4-hydroxybenzoyl-CoA thioesterase
MTQPTNLFHTTLPVRFGDVDLARIVYYPRILHYSHVAFEEFFRGGVGVPYPQLVEERRLGFPTVRLETDFESPLRYGMELDVGVGIEKLGSTSVIFRYEFRAAPAGPLLARSRNVTVCVDMDTLAKREVPADLRTAFSRFVSSP